MALPVPYQPLIDPESLRFNTAWPVGPTSPRWGAVVPRGWPEGPTSPWPQRALPPGRPLPVRPTPGAGGGLATQFGQAALNQPYVTVGQNPPTSAVWGPTARSGASGASGAARALGSGAPRLAGSPIPPAPPAETPVAIRGLTGAGQAAGRGGLRGLAQQAWQGIRSGGLRGAARASIPGVVGGVVGNLVDESNILGGRDSLANDLVGKAAKWGGTGAAIGSVIPGVGTLTGAGVGALVGVGHEALERFGVLGTDPEGDALAEAQRIATETNLHPNALAELDRQYQTLLAIAGDDSTERQKAAEAYLEQVRQAALAQAQDPTVFMGEEELRRHMLDQIPLGGEVPPELLTPGQRATRERAGNMGIQAAMADLWQPFAVEYMARTDAAAEALRRAAATTGPMQPVFEAQAAEMEARAPRDLMNLLGQMQAAPYVEALQNQASMLKQQAQSMQAQAMAAVNSGAWDQFMQWQAQGGASGGGDLTATLEQLGL